MVRMRRAAATFGLVLFPIVALACSFGGGPTADPAKVFSDDWQLADADRQDLGDAPRRPRDRADR